MREQFTTAARAVNEEAAARDRQAKTEQMISDAGLIVERRPNSGRPTAAVWPGSSLTVPSVRK
jgi:hypothetical protein